jgi:predicted nuclease of restriction endonuclease-like (RecB) superfamily
VELAIGNSSQTLVYKNSSRQWECYQLARAVRGKLHYNRQDAIIKNSKELGNLTPVDCTMTTDEIIAEARNIQNLKAKVEKMSYMDTIQQSIESGLLQYIMNNPNHQWKANMLNLTTIPLNSPLLRDYIGQIELYCTGIMHE